MQGNPMQGLIDKLCDHLTAQRIKLLIESGFDDWQTITFMKGDELVQMGYSSQECIVIMVAVNSHSKEMKGKDIFNQQVMKKVLAASKQRQAEMKEQIMQQQAQNRMKQMKLQQENVYPPEEIKQFPQKPITQAVLLKGVTLKGKQRVALNKVTLMSLEDKGLTHILQLQRVPNIQNLHLGHNHIYRIENLMHVPKIKILKLQANQICKLEGLDKLLLLEQLFVNDNHISRLQGLTNNKYLHSLYINNQRSKRPLTFQEQTCECLAYCLQNLSADGNRIEDINNLKHLKVVNTVHLKNNNLSDMGDMSEPLGSMERLKILDFKGNPICSIPKYRDYMVILSKNLQQLDSKKILTTERQYLVKLYSLKHAKQVREQTQNSKHKIHLKGPGDLQVIKLEEGTGMYYHGNDLRGNVTYANTKIQKK